MSYEFMYSHNIEKCGAANILRNPLYKVKD